MIATNRVEKANEKPEETKRGRTKKKKKIGENAQKIQNGGKEREKQGRWESAGTQATINPFSLGWVASHVFRCIRSSAEESLCTARMPGRETCTGTLQLQCGTAALHLARWRRRLCQPQRPESCVRAGDAFQRRRRDRGTRVSRTWKAGGGTKRERKVRRKKTGVERRIKRERKESHVVAGSRQRRHTQRKEKHPPIRLPLPPFFPFLFPLQPSRFAISLVPVGLLVRPSPFS